MQIKNYSRKLILPILCGTLAASFFVGRAGAGSKSVLVDGWYDRTFSAVPLKKILVIGLSKDDATRQLFETEFSKDLGEKGINAVSSLTLIPIGKPLNREIVVNTLKNTEFDSVLVSRLVSANSSSKYVPGQKEQRSAAPENRYSGTFDQNYQRNYDTVYSPGYLVESKTVIIETEIYSRKTQKLIWSGTSETVDPNSKGELIKSLGTAIARDLSALGFIGRLNK